MSRKRPVTAVVGAVTDRDSANKYGLVLLLLGVSYITSVYSDSAGGITLVMFVQLATLWLTFSASESRRAQRLAGIACVIMAILILGTAIFGVVYSFDKSAVRLLALVSVALYIIAPLVILRHLLRRSVVDLRTILGAVCIYIMLGMMFAFTYRAISVWQTDPPFFGADGRGDNAAYLFFSFITLTTTGYGNLVPATNPGQSVAVLEAIVGQLFLVTALAKIVNAWRMPGLAPSRKPDQPPPGA